MPAEWPCRGYNGPQPWDPNVANRPALTQGLVHGLVSSGGGNPDDVRDLAILLANLGIPTSVSQGQNPAMVYDQGMAAAVAKFCADYGAQADPQIVQATTADVVDHWLWETLFRAVHKARATEQAAQEAS